MSTDITMMPDIIVTDKTDHVSTSRKPDISAGSVDPVPTPAAHWCATMMHHCGGVKAMVSLLFAGRDGRW